MDEINLQSIGNGIIASKQTRATNPKPCQNRLLQWQHSTALVLQLCYFDMIFDLFFFFLLFILFLIFVIIHNKCRGAMWHFCGKTETGVCSLLDLTRAQNLVQCIAMPEPITVLIYHHSWRSAACRSLSIWITNQMRNIKIKIYYSQCLYSQPIAIQQIPTNSRAMYVYVSVHMLMHINRTILFEIQMRSVSVVLFWVAGGLFVDTLHTDDGKYYHHDYYYSFIWIYTIHFPCDLRAHTIDIHHKMCVYVSVYE